MAGSSSNIKIEIVINEKKFAIEASLASAASSPVTSPSTHSYTSASDHLNKKAKSIHSISAKTKRRLSFNNSEKPPDIEDYGKKVTTKKKARVPETLLHRFRSKRGLFVTDVTKTEWCEKQMELSLFSKEWKDSNEAKRHGDDECCNKNQSDLALVYGGGRKMNKARKAGIARHTQLEKEVSKRVEVEVKSPEDDMALKLVNFINGVNQLHFDGLTRELPIVAFAFEEGIWMVGQIDEIRMPKTKRGHNHNAILVETKTRVRDTIPSEPQKRNGRIQLMCYKYLWDNLVAPNNDFPSKQFFDYFGLNPKRTLYDDVKEACADSGFCAWTLDDVVTCYKNTCKMLPIAHDQLVLRYEYQKDRSLLDEDKFRYDEGWLKKKIWNCLEFWLGEREANYAAENEEEKWKCRFCDFNSDCPAYTESSESLTSDDSDD